MGDRNNLFSLYSANVDSANFWVRRDSWHRVIGYVISIGGMTEGSLESFGQPPYFGNPEVKMAIYSTDGILEDVSRQNNAGSWQWSIIDTPDWWTEEKEDSLRPFYPDE